MYSSTHHVNLHWQGFSTHSLLTSVFQKDLRSGVVGCAAEMAPCSTDWPWTGDFSRPVCIRKIPPTAQGLPWLLQSQSCRQNLILHFSVPDRIPKPKLSCHGASLGLTRLLAWPRVSEGCQCPPSPGMSEKQPGSCLAGSAGVNWGRPLLEASGLSQRERRQRRPATCPGVILLRIPVC